MSQVRRVVIDWSWRDQKLRRLIDIPEIKDELFNLILKHIIPLTQSTNIKIGLYWLQWILYWMNRTTTRESSSKGEIFILEFVAQNASVSSYVAQILRNKEVWDIHMLNYCMNVYNEFMSHGWFTRTSVLQRTLMYRGWITWNLHGPSTIAFSISKRYINLA